MAKSFTNTELYERQAELARRLIDQAPAGAVSRRIKTGGQLTFRNVVFTSKTHKLDVDLGSDGERQSAMLWYVNDTSGQANGARSESEGSMITAPRAMSFDHPNQYGDERDFAALLDTVEAGEWTAIPPAHVVYGFLNDDDKVQMLFWLEEGGNWRYYATSYVYEGDDFPPLFRGEIPAGQSTDPKWYRRFWEQYELGRVVPLDEHLRRLSAPLNFVYESGKPGYLEFYGTDRLIRTGLYPYWGWQKCRPGDGWPADFNDGRADTRDLRHIMAQRTFQF